MILVEFCILWIFIGVRSHVIQTLSGIHTVFLCVASLMIQPTAFSLFPYLWYDNLWFNITINLYMIFDLVIVNLLLFL